MCRVERITAQHAEAFQIRKAKILLENPPPPKVPKAERLHVNNQRYFEKLKADPIRWAKRKADNNVRYAKREAAFKLTLFELDDCSHND